MQNIGWRQACSALLPEQYYDDAALAGRTQMWEQALSSAVGRERLRVTEHDGGIIGFAAKGPVGDDDVDRLGGRRLQLYAIYVLVEHYGDGIGDQLIDALLGQDPACLWVLRDNARARRFYQKHGFRPDGAEKDLGEQEGDRQLRGVAEIRMVR